MHVTGKGKGGGFYAALKRMMILDWLTLLEREEGGPGVCSLAWILLISLLLLYYLGLYTDESPGLKVDPVVVLVLSLGFIFSVVALHGTSEFSLLSLPPIFHLSLYSFPLFQKKTAGAFSCIFVFCFFFSAATKKKTKQNKTNRQRKTVIAKLTRKFTS